MDNPSLTVRNQIDYITINNRFKNSIKSAKTLPGADVPTDHNLLVATINIRFKTVSKHNKRPMKTDIELLKNENTYNDIKQSLNCKFEALAQNTTANIVEAWQKAKDTINAVTTEKLIKSEAEFKQKWMTDEILQMMNERRKLKTIDPTGYRTIHKEIRKRIKAAKEDWLKEQCEEMERYERQHDSFQLFKKIKEITRSGSKTLHNALEDRNGNILTDLLQKQNRWKEYAEELFEDKDRPPIGTEETTTESGPSILEEEVVNAIKRLKKRKATGPDNIHAEILKMIEGEGLKFLTRLFNSIYDSGEIPKDWLKSTFVTIPKKPNARKCSDFRTISLMSQVLKAFLYIIHSRIYRRLENHIGKTQFGFRNGLGTRDALFGMQVLLQRCRDYDTDIHICFTDFEKAFDKIQHRKMIDILKKTAIDGKDIRIIQNLYWNQSANVRVENTHTDEVKIQRGVRQGCVLSPLLFNIYSEEIMEEALGDSQEGILINGEPINNIRYADDTALMATSVEDLQLLLDRTKSKCEENGLKINTGKTKYMVISRRPNNTNLFIDNVQIQRVDKFKYLGSYINDKLDHTQEIRCRIE